MPPKQKKKKSKKQLLEEQAKLQEELKIQEELERIRKAEEEKKRLEEEEIKRQEDEKLRQEEEARLSDERDLLHPWLEKVTRELIKIKEVNKAEEEWKKYIECDPMPDPTIEKQMTAYITLLSEQKIEELEEALNKFQQTEKIVKNIYYSLGDALEEYNSVKKMWCYNYITTLRSLAKRKIDEAISEILMHADEHLLKPPEPVSSTLTATSKHMKGALDPVQVKETYIKSQREEIRVGLWLNYQNTGHKFKPIDFDELTMYADMPRQYADDPCVMRAMWTSSNLISTMIETPELVVGGVYEVHIYRFPELPKNVREWRLRPVKTLENMLVQRPYPPSDLISGMSLSNINPLKMMYQLPNNVYLPDPNGYKVCWWDSTTLSWSNNEISDLNFDTVSKTIAFKIKKLAPLAVVIPRITDYPYSYFYLRAVSDDKVLLDITGKRMPFSFIITPGNLEFVNTENIIELRYLEGVKMPPGALLFELSSCGVHLIPEPRDCEASGIKNKSLDAEELAIMDLSMNIRTFAFRSSKWNKDASEEMVLVRVRENLEYDSFFAEDEEHDWRTVAWHANKCHFVNARENSSEMNLNIPQGHQTHFMLQIAMDGNCTEMAENRMNELRSVDLSDTVKKTLRLLKILSFT